MNDTLEPHTPEIHEDITAEQLYDMFNEFEPFDIGLVGEAKDGSNEVVLSIEGICQAGDDAYFSDFNTMTAEGLMGIFDGMGGSAEKAKIASAVAAETARDAFDRRFGEAPINQEDAEHEMASLFTELAGIDLQLDTTALLARTWRNKEGEMQVTIGSMGDCQALLIDGASGEVASLSKPHDIFEIAADEAYGGMIKKGVDATTARAAAEAYSDLLADADGVDDFTARAVDLMAAHPEVADYAQAGMYVEYRNQRNVVTSHLEMIKQSPEELRVTTYPVEVGQRLVAMSDGISDPLTHGEIRDIVVQGEDIQGTTKELIAAANNKTGARKKRDDKAVLVFELDTEEEPEIQAFMKEVNSVVSDPAKKVSEYLDQFRPVKVIDVPDLADTEPSIRQVPAQEVPTEVETVPDVAVEALPVEAVSTEQFIKYLDLHAFDQALATEDERNAFVLVQELAGEFKRASNFEPAFDKIHKVKSHAVEVFSEAGPLADLRKEIFENISLEASFINNIAGNAVENMWHYRGSTDQILRIAQNVRTELTNKYGENLERALTSFRLQSDVVDRALDPLVELSQIVEEADEYAFRQSQAVQGEALSEEEQAGFVELLESGNNDLQQLVGLVEAKVIHGNALLMNEREDMAEVIGSRVRRTRDAIANIADSREFQGFEAAGYVEDMAVMIDQLSGQHIDHESIENFTERFSQIQNEVQGFFARMSIQRADANDSL